MLVGTRAQNMDTTIVWTAILLTLYDQKKDVIFDLVSSVCVYGIQWNYVTRYPGDLR
jgi:hypothetical protein